MARGTSPGGHEERERKRERERHTHRNRETQRERKREGERDRERQTQKARGLINIILTNTVNSLSKTATKLSYHVYIDNTY